LSLTYFANAKKVKTFLLIGANISESLSPVIQRSGFDKLGVRATYSLKELSRNQELDNFVSGLRSTNIAGFNVTSPFKEQIIRHLSSIDPLARKIGAVNTVKVGKARRLLGYNTDYDGIIASLEKLDVSSKSKKRQAVVLGAGGAAKACAYALLNTGHSKVFILNRTTRKAVEISKQFQIQFPRATVEALPLDQCCFDRSLKDCGLLINALSNSKEKDYFPLKVSLFRETNESMKVFDLGYKYESHLLRIARKEGLKTIDGLVMLVTQAAKSFEIWTGKRAPIRTMMNAAKGALLEKKRRLK
jgi:shikimate dehydrogenase